LLYLDVPFLDKEEAKILGAEWDQSRRKWYVQERDEYHNFSRWIPNLNQSEMAIVLSGGFFIAVGQQECAYCGKTADVISFGLDNYYEFYNKENDYDTGYPEPVYWDDAIHFADSIGPLPIEAFKFISNINRNFKYSRLGFFDYKSNHCNQCGKHQNINGINSPFIIDSVQKASNLKLYHAMPKEDLVVSCSYLWGSHDYLVNDYAKIIELDPEWRL